MRRDELSVEQGKARATQAIHEPGKRDLRRVAAAREHALAKERGAEGHTVDTADQLPLGPDFERMGMAHLVQVLVEARDLGTDPGFRPVGAGIHDSGEVAVHLHLVIHPPYRLGQ